MTHNASHTPGIIGLLFASLASSGSLCAQGEATTLAALAQRSAVIVQARALALRPDAADPSRHAARFAVQDILAGALSERHFELREPARRACGRALHGIAPGVSYVAFLQRDGQTGALRLTAGGSRSLVQVEPGLLAHIRALRSAPTVRGADLCAALGSRSARVREDAAHSLPFAADLAGIDATGRAMLAAAVEQAIAQSKPTLTSLLTVAARVNLDEVARPLILHFVNPKPGEASGLDRLIVRALRRLDPRAVADGIATEFTVGQAANAKRTVELMHALPGVTAPGLATEQVLSAILSDPDKRALRRLAGSTWISAGLSFDSLERIVGSSDACRCREEAERIRPPRTRSIRGPRR